MFTCYLYRIDGSSCLFSFSNCEIISTLSSCRFSTNSLISDKNILLCTSRSCAVTLNINALYIKIKGRKSKICALFTKEKVMVFIMPIIAFTRRTCYLNSPTIISKRFLINSFVCRTCRESPSTCLTCFICRISDSKVKCDFLCTDVQPNHSQQSYE